MGSLSLLQGIFPTQGSNPGIKPSSPALQADSLPAEPLVNISNLLLMDLIKWGRYSAGTRGLVPRNSIASLPLVDIYCVKMTQIYPAIQNFKQKQITFMKNASFSVWFSPGSKALLFLSGMNFALH